MRGLHAARALLMLAASFGFTGWATAGQQWDAGLAQFPAGQGAALSELAEVRMPSGLADLCGRDASFCSPKPERRERFALTPERWRAISDVNTAVNVRIASTTDQRLYGRPEFWTLPDRAGDCEDFVLLKRKLLIDQGFPASGLLITVVQDENGEGHAVLTIPTAGGDIVLDNRRDEILHWWATGYQFVKRQSAINPTKWVALAKDRLQPANDASASEAP